jgi:serpin B
VGAKSVTFDLVRQKAKIVVNEEGTEAAAVTGGAALECMRAPLLQADRPFVYAILDERSQTVVFSGTYQG